MSTHKPQLDLLARDLAAAGSETSRYVDGENGYHVVLYYTSTLVTAMVEAVAICARVSIGVEFSSSLCCFGCWYVFVIVEHDPTSSYGIGWLFVCVFTTTYEIDADKVKPPLLSKLRSGASNYFYPLPS
ncbi:unnamed protein product [Cylicocyclus nassatus]|uniref:Uncharacterized protein n=1 Tax=Cylicocyclus nassatus TaxID=53992 RepID=A0AA36GEU1_CYLNA|nr:unnamed protein product [Cylicocyclus nassatus]